MKLTITATQTVQVEPLEVVEKLLQTINLNPDSYFKIENDQPFYVYTETAGPHEVEKVVPISLKKYNYIQALKTVVEYLKGE